MIDFTDRIKLFNWIRGRAETARLNCIRMKENKNPSMDEFAIEMREQGAAIALMELNIAILADSWPSVIAESSDELTYLLDALPPEFRRDT